MNVLKYIKNNPKKSVAGAVILGYVGRWLNGLYIDNNFRHVMCRKISETGSETVDWFYQPKTITVFLNPAANNGKAVKLFEKNAAPILHLSGCNVKVIRLDYEGQAKQLMSVIENTDIIVAAGGNGTLSEVVTGLLRRTDFDNNWKNIPIGVIPLGETNTLCRQLSTGCDPNNYKQWIMTATSDIIKSNCRPVDVLKITGENGKNVFALSDIRWGSYSDAHGKTSKYWFWGPLKKYMTYVFASYKSNTKVSRELNLEYNDPEPLVEELPKSVVVTRNNSATNTLFRSVHNLISWILKPLKGKNTAGTAQVICESSDSLQKTEPETESFEKSHSFKTLEIMAAINTHNPDKKREVASAHISIENDDFTMLDFIKNGPKKFLHGRPQPIDLVAEIDASKFKLSPLNLEGSWFKIDSEDYEAMPCSVQLLPNKVKMICSHVSQ